MLNKSAASAVLALILAPSVSAAWSAGVTSYALDSSQQACVARTEVKRNATLALIFPKDKRSLPVIRVTEDFSNFLNGKKYLGVRFLDEATGLKVHGFPVKSGRTQYYYMVPKSSSDFNAFMNYIRVKGKLKLLKLFNDRGQIKANTVEFSLSGSTNATNTIKRCLGSSTLLSSSQTRLIDVLDKYQREARAGRPGTDLDSINRRGANMINSLRRIMDEGDRLEPLERELSVMESNPRYIELKESFESNTAIFNGQNSIVRELIDNQDFYNNADQIITDLKSEISLLGTLLIRLRDERGQISERLVDIEREISRQQLDVERDRENMNLRSQELSSVRSLLSQVNRNIGDASVELGQKEERLRNLQINVRTLRQNLRVAEGRYHNRENLKREARRRLFDRFGRPEVLKDRISDAERKLEQVKTAKRVNLAIKESVKAVQAKAREVEGVDAQIANTAKRISCLEKLIADGSDQSSGRACDVRIRGSLADTLKRVQNRKSQLESQRTSEVSSLESLISNISSPRNGNRIKEAINALKSCDTSDIRDCRAKASSVTSLVDRRISKNDSEISEKEKVFKEASAKLVALEKALDENVRNLDQKLRDEVRAANDALRDNEREIESTIDRVDFLERELDSLERSQSRLSAQLGSAQSAFSSAERVYQNTLSRLEEYKRSVGYEQILARQSVVKREIDSKSRSLNASNRRLDASRARKERISREIDTYPARITDASEKRDAAEIVLNDIGPEYRELAEDVSRVRSAYNRVVSLLKPDLVRYQAEFKTVIKNLF